MSDEVYKVLYGDGAYIHIEKEVSESNLTLQKNKSKIHDSHRVCG